KANQLEPADWSVRPLKTAMVSMTPRAVALPGASLPRDQSEAPMVEPGASMVKLYWGTTAWPSPEILTKYSPAGISARLTERPPGPVRAWPVASATDRRRMPEGSELMRTLFAADPAVGMKRRNQSTSAGVLRLRLENVLPAPPRRWRL